MIRALAIAVVLVGCGPRVDPKGPGALPDVQEGPAPETTTLPPRKPPPPTPAPVADDDAAPAPTPADATPPHATVTLAPAKGSKVLGQLSLVQGEDGTTIVGTISGLAKNTAYLLSKRDQCFAFKPDDDSKRSKVIVYGFGITSDRNGVAKVSDSAQIVHLDGPMSLMGAIFVVTKSILSAELACGRVVAP
jgi:hypothetical protein